MKYRKFAVILPFIAIFIMACQDEIPVNELTKTRLAIDKALSVKADEYAPEEYNEAVKQLAIAHDKIIFDESPEECIKSADVSYNKAVEAYSKAAVLYSETSLKKADEAIAAADEVFAEKFSPDKFREAKDLKEAAAKEYEAKNYLGTIDNANEAYEKALKAMEESIDNRYQLEAMIEEVSTKIAKVEQYDYETYASEQHSLAVENLRKAQDRLDNNKLKDCFAYAEIADKNADEALKLTMDGVTGVKIADAEDAIAGAEKSSGASVAPEDLAAAKEALVNARQYRDEGNYDDCVNYCNEAVRLANEVIEAGKKTDADAVAKANIEQDQKDQNADNDNNKDITQSTANNTGDKDSTKDGEVVKEDDNYYYYKVRTWEKYGDCLWRISGEFYDNPRLWTKIYKANKKKIKNPDLIRPGWIIKVPKLKK